MAKIAVDIALLLPEAINKICIDINQKEHAEAFSDLSKSNNHPHITLAMGVIDEKDIGKINSKLNEIIKQFSKLNLRILRLNYEITPEKKKSYNFEIKLSDKLKKLHATIIRELLPVFSYDVNNKMFFLDFDETFNEVSKFWVKTYGRIHSNPENYRPHISLKCRNGECPKFPKEFVASKVVLCHLGNYCTCRTVLGSYKLR
jgi:hypothetical protein